MSAVNTWSTTAADNDSAPPDGFPEGMNPSAVNDACREVMAAIATWRTALDVTTIDLGHATDTTIARASSGVISVEGETVHTNSASRSVTALSVEVGNASDTTVTRASAGAIAVEGNQLTHVIYEDNLTVAGDFTGSPEAHLVVIKTKEGKLCTLVLPTMSHSLAFDPESDAFIPEAYRAASVEGKTYFTSAADVRSIFTSSTGTVSFLYYTWAGGDSNNTSTNGSATITWYVDD